MSKIRYVVLRVTLEGDIPELATRIAGKVQTTQGVALAEAVEVHSLPDSIHAAIDVANSFGPLNADGTPVQP